jgi:adenosylcobinamide kinase/adenosylcobinamide-phosphate guanylyltransferase
MIAPMDLNPVVAGLHLVLGGARSGKSAYAQSLAAAQEAAGREVCVVATALGGDAEMRARIARHRADRPAHWRLVEPPPARHALARAVDDHAGARCCLLVDCLTLWLSQAISPPPGHAPLEADDETGALLAALRRAAGPVLLVGNEIGLGVVPLDPTSRHVVDALGIAHQRIAALAERVTWMVAGLPVAVKGGAT